MSIRHRITAQQTVVGVPLLPDANLISHGTAYAHCTEHLGTRRDSKWGTIPSWMGHNFAPMGHYSAMMGHQMGHQSAKMGHKGTPTDTILMSVGVMVKQKARRGGSMQFSGAGRPKSQVRVAKVDPRQFCDLRRLWYNPPYKFSAQQGWRHGVRSRSLGGMCSQLV